MKVRDYAAKLQEDKDMNGNFDELEAALKAEVTTIDEVKQKAMKKPPKPRPKSSARLKKPLVPQRVNPLQPNRPRRRRSRCAART